MKLLIFDTETTGLPKSRQPAANGPNNWPHIVSISWIVLDTDTNTELKTASYVIRPEGWSIPADSVKIHGITDAIALERGVSLFDVMTEFIQEDCHAWVAHNLEFDMSVVVNAVLWDLKINFPATPQRKFCTMLLSKPICKLPGKYGNNYKPPKLKELYFHAFGRHPEELQLHNSMYDVRILTDIIKHYFPLRVAMGLVASSEIKPDGRTLTICLKHAKGDNDMGE
jgi:DNA polymerase III epsilon subunit-like protein